MMRLRPSNDAAAALVVALCLCAGCSEERRPSGGGAAASATYALLHRFEVGQSRRFLSKTVERGRIEVSIELRSRWTVTKVRDSGAAEVSVTVESYRQSVFPVTALPQDVRRMNEGLAGATFRLLVPPNGHHVEHLGQEGLPELSTTTVASLKAALAGHVLRLPEEPVGAGKRWTRESGGEADAGPGGLASRSSWRVLSVRQDRGKSVIELVCLTTMKGRSLQAKGVVVETDTEFHYSYLWNATDGVLEAVTSRGTSVVRAAAEPDATTMGPPQKVSYEGSLRLLGR